MCLFILISYVSVSEYISEDILFFLVFVLIYRYVSCVWPLSMVIDRVCVTSSKRLASLCLWSHLTATLLFWQRTMATLTWSRSYWTMFPVGVQHTVQLSSYVDI